ncbi:MAG TPA: preprotein translocase subunit YajC [Micromonosporaceae bacterium]|nr:preprotein translocase subunit YajC [Micromonosporaceae bacterium]
MAAGNSGSSSLTSLLLIVAIILVFYFILYRPMKRRQQTAQQQQRDMRSNLGEGDKIVTIGGLFGTVVSTDDESVTLEISPGVTARYDRNAIARILPEPVETPHTYEDDDDVVDGADLDYGTDTAHSDAAAEDVPTEDASQGATPDASDDEEATPKRTTGQSD